MAPQIRPKICIVYNDAVGEKFYNRKSADLLTKKYITSKCSIQLPNCLQVAGHSFRQSSGNCPLNKEFEMPSRTLSIPISPANAFRNNCNDMSIRTRRLLTRSSSCSKTMPVDVMFICIDFLTRHISKGFGNFCKISAATLSMNSSREMPLLPAPIYYTNC